MNFSIYLFLVFSSPSFGIAFDIDGVLLRGQHPIGGSAKALRRLYVDSTFSGNQNLIFNFHKRPNKFNSSSEPLPFSSFHFCSRQQWPLFHLLVLKSHLKIFLVRISI